MLLALAAHNNDQTQTRDKLISELKASAICDEFDCYWSAQTFKYSWRNNDVETTSYVLKALVKVIDGDWGWSIIAPIHEQAEKAIAKAEAE